MAVQNSPLGELAAIRNIAMQKQAMNTPPPGAGQPPMPPRSVGPAALGGMSEEELMQSFAQKAATMPMQQPVPPTIPMSMPQPKETLNTFLTKPKINGKSLQEEAVTRLASKAGLSMPNILSAYTGGGLTNLMESNNFSGKVPGEGHGMEDNVYMPIVEREAGSQVGVLAVSPDEYVVDAHTMAAVGNGSPAAGADVMDEVIKNIRSKAYGTTQQPNEINGLAALQPLIERV